jgi:hypothetical protein
VIGRALPRPRWLLVALSLALLAGLAPPAAPPARGAAPELQLTAAARYDVQPERARVHVTLDTTITNTHRDRGTARTYYDTISLAVLPGTANFTVSSPGVTAGVSIRSATATYTLLTIRLGRRLFAGRHTPLRLQFDLPDKGGTALRDVRVGTSLVTFPVWAFGTEDTPGSSVTVAFPPGYNVQQQVGTMREAGEASDGRQVWTSGPLDDALAFFASFVADRPGAFEATSFSTAVAGRAVPVTIRAWTDDPSWGTRVGSLVRQAMPVLGAAVGLPYAGTSLVVQESVSRTIGGYAGLFDPIASTIQVAYYAGPFVVLHETAHAWFNGRLASERWILEGFASWYAAQAAARLKLDAPAPVMTPELRKAAIPLNAWPGVGRADAETVDYAYAATFALAGAIAARAGAAGLQSVWAAAAGAESAYQPFHAGAAVERGSPAPDWRGLLDLLEERTGGLYADLWRQWVVRPSEAALLDRRASARAAYAAAVVAAGDWELPPIVRRAMANWQFDQAASLIAASRAVLAQRSAIADAASAAGLTTPGTLRAAFEGPNGPAAGATEADLEQATIAAIQAAVASSHEVDGLFAQLGLLGLSPEQEVVAARAAFAAGSMGAAQAHAATAQATWQSADGRGRQRVLSIVVVLLGLLALLIAGAVIARTRRARRREAWP